MMGIQYLETAALLLVALKGDTPVVEEALHPKTRVAAAQLATSAQEECPQLALPEHGLASMQSPQVAARRLSAETASTV